MRSRCTGVRLGGTVVGAGDCGHVRGGGKSNPPRCVGGPLQHMRTTNIKYKPARELWLGAALARCSLSVSGPSASKMFQESKFL